MVNLFLDSGIRLSELIGLSPDDIHEDMVKVFGKGSKERYVFISQETMVDISLYLLGERPEPVADNKVFLTVDGYPLTKSRVQKILERAGKKDGTKQRLSPHKLRPSFSTLSLKYGSNLEHIRIILGHSDIHTTSKFYLHMADADVAEASKRSSPVVNLGLGKGIGRRVRPGPGQDTAGSPGTSDPGAGIQTKSYSKERKNRKSK